MSQATLAVFDLAELRTGDPDDLAAKAEGPGQFHVASNLAAIILAVRHDLFDLAVPPFCAADKLTVTDTISSQLGAGTRA